MSVRCLLFNLTMLTLVTGCSTDLDFSTADFGLGSLGSPAATPTSASEVELGLEPPQFDARSTGRHRGITRANCNSTSSLEAAQKEALELLRRRAANNGADYVRLAGSGDLEDRGFCSEGFFRVDGEGFVELDLQPAQAGENVADSLTARLEELDALLERGLINQSEYDQLREQVLDEAY